MFLKQNSNEEAYEKFQHLLLEIQKQQQELSEGVDEQYEKNISLIPIIDAIESKMKDLDVLHPKKFERISEKYHVNDIHELIAEAIDKSFKQNVEEFITNRFNSQKILMFCFGITQIMNIFVIFYDYCTNNEIDLFKFITISLYCFLNNFMFAGCFIYLYLDYTYSKNISTNKFLLDMIKYNKVKMEINGCNLKKEKKLPTLNFL